MTVQNENYREDYDGNDSTTSFPVSFYFLDETHLQVLLLDAAGVSTEQILNTDYTVTGAGNPAGGTVDMVVAPATGEQLTIIRDVPLTQTHDYIENDNFPADSHETALDKLTMIVQQQQEEIDRTFRVAAAYETDMDFEMIPEANELLAWNSTGTKIITASAAQIEFEIDKLYYDKTDIKVQAISDGAKIFGNLSFDVASSPVTVKFDGSDTIMTLTGGAGIDLYYNNAVTLRTQAGGIHVLDSSGSVPSITLFADNGTTALGRLRSNVGRVELATSDLLSDIRLEQNDGVDINYFIWCRAAGAIELYNAGAKVFSTRSTGINIFNGSNQMYIAETGSLWKMLSLTNGYPVLIAGYNSGGVEKNLFYGDPNAGIRLYYQGNKICETVSDALKFDDSMKLRLGFDNDFVLQFDGSNCAINTNTLTANMNFTYFNGSSTEVLAQFTPTGAVKLYFNNGLKFLTNSQGVTVNGPAMNFDIIDDSGTGDVKLINKIDNKFVLVRGFSGAAAKNMIVAYPQSFVALSYAGVTVFQTQNTGFTFGSGGTPLGQARHNGTDMYFDNNQNNGDLFLRVTSSGLKNVFSSDGISSNLYYQGVDVFKTWSPTVGVYGVNFTQGSVIIVAGAGSPEGVIGANVGSLYLRTDGGAGTSLYVKESGTGTTGWVGK